MAFMRITVKKNGCTCPSWLNLEDIVCISHLPHSNDWQIRLMDTRALAVSRRQAKKILAKLEIVE